MENNNNQPAVAEAERLLKAIFAEGEELDDNYPNTIKEKVGYSQYVAANTLSGIGKALNRLSRLYSLLAISEKDGENKLPDIITSNELRMALTPLYGVKRDIDEIVDMLSELYRATKVEPPKVDKA